MVKIVLFIVFVSLLAGAISGEDVASVRPVRCLRIACPQLRCKPGYVAAKLSPTDCCNNYCKKVLDCSVVRCAQVKCPADYISVTQPGSCCSTCQKDCSKFSCIAVACTGDQIPIVAEGECCPVCEKTCAAVSCMACKPNQTAVTVDDQCCPLCFDDAVAA